MPRHPRTPCPEPDGAEPSGIRPNLTGHDVFLDATGQCPWCGQTDEQAEWEARTERTNR